MVKEMGSQSEIVVGFDYLESLMCPENFVGCGVESFCFRDFGSNQVISVPYINELGNRFTRSTLERILESGVNDDANFRLTFYHDQLGEEVSVSAVNFAKSRIHLAVQRQNLAYQDFEQEPFLVNDNLYNFRIVSVTAVCVAFEEPGKTIGKTMTYLGDQHPDPYLHPNLIRTIHAIQPDWHNSNGFITNEVDEAGNIKVALIDF